MAKFLNCTELMPSTNQKSFYGKAKIENWIDENGKDIFILKSYCTPILIIYKDKLYRVSDTCEGDFSSTTLKHCRSFVDQYIANGVCHKNEFLGLDTINVNDLLLGRI